MTQSLTEENARFLAECSPAFANLQPDARLELTLPEINLMLDFAREEGRQDRPSQPHASSGIKEGQAVEVLREMVRLADLGFEASLAEPEENGNFAIYERAKRLIATHDALTPPTKQEEGAVAWRWRNPGNDWNYQCDRQRIPNVEMEPLYLHPAPSSSGWREEAARVAVSVERGLQGMAVYASAPMDLWDRFSNDVLKLIALAKEPRNG